MFFLNYTFLWFNILNDVKNVFVALNNTLSEYVVVIAFFVLQGRTGQNINGI